VVLPAVHPHAWGKREGRPRRDRPYIGPTPTRVRKPPGLEASAGLPPVRFRFLSLDRGWGNQEPRIARIGRTMLSAPSTRIVGGETCRPRSKGLAGIRNRYLLIDLKGILMQGAWLATQILLPLLHPPMLPATQEHGIQSPCQD
jgi:hypothetical protein